MLKLELKWDRPAVGSDRAEDRVLLIELESTGGNSATLPSHFIVAVDCSSSMEEAGKIEGAKQAAIAVAEKLRKEDRLDLAGYSSDVQELCLSAEGGTAGVQTVKSKVKSLKASGTTRMDLALGWLQKRLESADPDKAKVGILITDGQPTTASGTYVTKLDPLLDAAGSAVGQEAQLFCIGVGDPSVFNTGFLQSMAERGRGHFIFAKDARSLRSEVANRLDASQRIAAVGAQVKLELQRTTAQLKQYCRHEPDYFPLDPSVGAMTTVGSITSGRPTKLLARFSVQRSTMGSHGEQEIVKVTASAGGATKEAMASLNFTSSLSEAQARNNDVYEASLIWIDRSIKRDLTLTDDPNRTGELLKRAKENAATRGDNEGVASADSALQELQESGKLRPEMTTRMLDEALKEKQ